METIKIPVFPLSQFVKYIWVYESSKSTKTATNELLCCTDIRFAISQMHLNHKISILKLASEVNMSKRNFERKFLENVGLTPVFLTGLYDFKKQTNVRILGRCCVHRNNTII
jgi:AraC-like DNA-binding protein